MNRRRKNSICGTQSSILNVRHASVLLLLFLIASSILIACSGAPGATEGADHSIESEPETVHVSSDSESDFGTLEEAIEAVPPHSTIVLDAQQYELSAPLVISKSLIIQGAGVDATMITSSVGGAIILFEGDEQWTISDLTVERTSEFASRIMLIFGGEITLDNCRLTGGAGSEDESIRGDGLRLLGNAQATITNCSFVKNAGAGLVAGDTASATIERVTCSENGFGIVFGDDTAGVLRNSACAGNQNVGVLLTGNAQISVLNNIIENNGGTGMLIDLDSAGGEIRDNRLSQNQMSVSGTDFQIWGPFTPELVGNSCSNETDRPSSLGGDQDGIVFMMLDGKMRGQEIPAVPVKSTDNDCATAKCTGVTLFDAYCR